MLSLPPGNRPALQPFPLAEEVTNLHASDGSRGKEMEQISMSDLAIRIFVSAVMAWLACPAHAALFSVSTKIFVGASNDPASEHRILFDEGTAYDLSISEDRFATIYNSSDGKVVLLDRESKVQAVVTLDDLLKVTAQAKASVTEPEDRRRLGIEAKVDAAEGYTMKFDGTEYFVKTQSPADPTIAIAYGRFADLALRMNLLRPLGPPPFARMTLNSHIAGKGEVPTQLTLTLKRGKQLTRYRSSNEIGKLTAEDRESIERLHGFLSEYREVPLKEFPVP
jgi:hypothetical protein